MLSAPAGVSSTVAGSRWNVPLRVGQHDRQQIGQVRRVPAAVGQREAAAQEQQAAAAPIHKLADQLLLRRGEVARFHGADDEP